MRPTVSLSNVLTILVWTLHLAAKGCSMKSPRRYGKYLVHNSDTKGNQKGRPRSGILETVYSIHTSAVPTTAHGNTSPSSTDAQVNLPSLKTKLDLKTKFSAPSNVNTAISNEPSYRNTENGPQNLTSYSLDPPNSFPLPTSIPAIDTFSVTSPTPMRSIDDEMNGIENLPLLPPIGSEMRENEKIPGIAQITSEQIPPSSEEEEAWERSHVTCGDFKAGHASHANLKVNSASSNTTTVHARRSEFVAWSPSDFSRSSQARRLEKLISKLTGSRRENTDQNTNKADKDKNLGYRYAHMRTTTSKKRVEIPPPKPIDPIQPLLENFQKEKPVGDIKEHVIDMEKIKPHEAIDKHLISIESQPNIQPIEKHLSKEQSDTLEPIENHQLKTVEQ